jgi:hypothetical protein
MDWKSTRLFVCMTGMGLAQWALVARLINEQAWMAVMMVCLGAFGIAKSIEYAKGVTVAAPETK